ncbi:hypothetical protein ABZ467_36505 [Streptomyces sp. NPDC005727]|uniref:hypothetical protein n=1 Tax=Streptomyces sp. NPDC005727 TaxID=3157053 RepID=UPI0033E4B925
MSDVGDAPDWLASAAGLLRASWSRGGGDCAVAVLEYAPDVGGLWLAEPTLARRFGGAPAVKRPAPPPRHPEQPPPRHFAAPRPSHPHAVRLARRASGGRSVAEVISRSSHNS